MSSFLQYRFPTKIYSLTQPIEIPKYFIINNLAQVYGTHVAITIIRVNESSGFNFLTQPCDGESLQRLYL